MVLVNAPVALPDTEPRLFPEVDQLITRLCTPAHSPLLVDMLTHHLHSGGKQLRPCLILGLGELLGLARSQLVGWAAACEMLHNGSLIHDDLQDRDCFRRGQPTVWHRYGAANAINAGNFLLLGGLQALQDSPLAPEVKAELAQRYSQMATDIVTGQSLEFELPQHLDSPQLPALYLRCISLKTSALFAAGAAGVGLIEGRGYAELYSALFAKLGLLFQIQDDVLDLYGNKGREAPGCDIREGKISALVVQLLQHAPEQLDWLAPLLAKPYDQTETAEILRVRHALNQARVPEALAAQMQGLINEIRQLTQERGLTALNRWMNQMLRTVLRPISHLDAFSPLYREET
ncbi:MAG: polyprenyl synthetase family protein [Candidatus Sericytochromatia bacterium]